MVLITYFPLFSCYSLARRSSVFMFAYKPSFTPKLASPNWSHPTEILKVVMWTKLSLSDRWGVKVASLHIHGPWTRRQFYNDDCDFITQCLPVPCASYPLSAQCGTKKWPGAEFSCLYLSFLSPLSFLKKQKVYLVISSFCLSFPPVNRFSENLFFRSYHY
jgi:hypothetical protein